MPFKKITDYELNVIDLPDRPSNAGITTDQLKKWFDGRTDKEVKILFNNLIDELMGVNGAVQIGAEKLDDSDNSDGNIQAKLNFIKAHADEIVAEMIATIRDDITRAQNAAETAAQTSVNAMNRAENAADTAAENAAEKAVYDVRELLEEHVVDSENARDEAVQAAENAANDAVTLVRAALEALVLESETAKNEAQNAKTNAETAQAQAEKARDDAQAAQRMAEDAKTAAVNAQANAERAKNDAEQIATQASTDAAVQAANKAAADVSAMLAGYVQDGQNARNDAQSSANQASQAEAAAREAQTKAEEARDAAEAIAGGDFLERSVYDPQGKRTDIFAEIEKKANAADVYSKTEADNKFNVMVVEMERYGTATSSSPQRYKADKTYAEIKAHIDNGGTAVVQDGSTIYSLTRVSTSAVEFANYGASYISTIEITKSSTIFTPELTSLMPKAGGTFTGTVKAPTPDAGTNNTQIATTSFVQNAINSIPVPEVKQADWTQNDSNAADYVKNRTHYIGEGFDEMCPITTGVVLEDGTWETGILRDGEEYIVVLDGNTYHCVAHNIGYGPCYLGNPQLAEWWDIPNPIVTDVPFCIMWEPGEADPDLGDTPHYWQLFTPDGSDNHVWQVGRPNGGTRYYPLDPRFIPSTFATKADLTAAIGNAIGGSY